KWQKKIFLLCWLAYAGGYLCRANLAIVLPKMIDSFQWNKTTVGLIGSAFFWAYAVGQLINGSIGDRVNCRRFIFAGLFASAVLNIFVGCSSSLVLIIILWAVNGFCLSMLWGPMVKTFSLWFSRDKYSSVAVSISISMIAGYFIAWGLVGSILSYTSWRYAFWIPALIVIVYSFIWLSQMRNRPEEVGFESFEVSEDLKCGMEEQIEKDNHSPSLFFIIRTSKLWILAIACIAQGVVKDSITLWGPTFLMDTQGLGQKITSLVSLTIPLFSLAGILFAGWMNKLLRLQEKKTIFVLLLGASAACLFTYVFLHVSTSLCVLFLSLASGLMYGANSLLLTLIPLNFGKYNKVSAVAGFLDFTSYMGAAFAGVMTGFIADYMNWSSVVLIWVALSLFGGVSILISLKYDFTAKIRNSTFLRS
ncbi:MAG: MFS transporter, partial [Clostridiales bacterium]|nr:MFS transporter [Clostridiales bacterium]